jgi:hypothetical protein
MKELDIPPEVLGADDGVEFVRFWVAGGQDHVSLLVGAMGDTEVQQWGMILADISMHVIRGLKQDGSQDSEAVLRAKIEQSYFNRLKKGGDNISGSLLGTRQ